MADDDWDSTLTLLTRARSGDRSALDELFGRYIPGLRRWASGRLPSWARDLADTQDLVQETVLATFRKIDGFEHRGEGALRAYLRQALMNRVRDEIRRSRRSPETEQVGLLEEREELGQVAPIPSPLETAIEAERVERYEAALKRLSSGDRELVVGRIELEMTYPELAVATGKPSPDAARMAVGRALLRLAEELRGPGPAVE